MQPSAHEVSTKPIKMKSIKLLVLVLGITSLLLAGCKTCCQEKCSSAKAACGMECCTNISITTRWKVDVYSDLPIPDSAVILLVVRGNRLIAPRGSTVFESGDHVHLFCTPEDVPLLRLLFGRPEG